MGLFPSRPVDTTSAGLVLGPTELQLDPVTLDELTVFLRYDLVFKNPSVLGDHARRSRVILLANHQHGVYSPPTGRLHRKGQLSRRQTLSPERRTNRVTDVPALKQQIVVKLVPDIRNADNLASIVNRPECRMRNEILGHALALRRIFQSLQQRREIIGLKAKHPRYKKLIRRSHFSYVTPIARLQLGRRLDKFQFIRHFLNPEQSNPIVTFDVFPFNPNHMAQPQQPWAY